MTLEVSIRPDKAVRRRVVARIQPGKYGVVLNHSSGRPKNISFHVYPKGNKVAVYEFPNGASIFRYPATREIPLKFYTKRNLQAVLRGKQLYEHPLETRHHAKGRLLLRNLPVRRGAGASLRGRRK